MKTMIHKSTNLALILALVVAMLPIRSVLAGKSSPPGLSTLEPGGFREITQDLNINIVFVGYEPGSGAMQIDQAAFTSELSSSYRPVLRYPSFYLGNQFQGLTFTLTTI